MDRKKLVQELEGEVGIAALILFGSHASGHADSKSDIDLGAFYETAIPGSMEILQLKQKLSDLMGVDVDFIVLNEASPILAMQVIQNGTPLFIKNMKAYRDFEVKLITDYADLKRVLKPFEENILKRKLHG
ncbi:MAG: nucleotidyltransferase domain-containing protein [Chlamydiia bacterium]|nr:nucleotidyltransferase domain-containing protein [Chlamydiia bacterium]